MSIYAGYATARVAITAPVAGVGTAALPAVVEVAVGEDALTGAAVAGVVLGLIAIALVSMAPSDGHGSVMTSLRYGLGGALGLGMLLLGLAQAGEDSGMWPLATARLAGFAALAAVMVLGGVATTLDRPTVRLVVAIAILNTGGNALFVLATRAGSTTIAAVITSMFPAVTVLWAWRVFGERVRAVQVVGLACALASVVIIARA